MCSKIKDFDGNTFPHWHNRRNKKIILFVPEKPDRRDLNYLVEALKTKNLVFYSNPELTKQLM